MCYNLFIFSIFLRTIGEIISLLPVLLVFSDLCVPYFIKMSQTLCEEMIDKFNNSPSILELDDDYNNETQFTTQQL